MEISSHLLKPLSQPSLKEQANKNNTLSTSHQASHEKHLENQTKSMEFWGKKKGKKKDL